MKIGLYLFIFFFKKMVFYFGVLDFLLIFAPENLGLLLLMFILGLLKSKFDVRNRVQI